MLVINWFNNVFAESKDCPNLINLAIGLNLNIKKPILMDQMLINCCNITGIVCDTNQNVKKIDWPNMALNGFLNGSAIPQTVNFLRLNGQNISGPFPILPRDLQATDLRNNKLTGSLTFPLPSNLETLFISNNNVGGYLQPFPIALEKIQILNNRFMGTLSLNRPSVINVSGNRITDVVVGNTSDITFCDLSKNPLLGNQKIEILTMCTKDNLYSFPILATYSKELTVAFTQTETEIYQEINTIKINNEEKNTTDGNPTLVLILVGGLVGLCFIVFIASFLIKKPKIHSKFGRQNSFGTLNTMATKKTTSSN